MFDNPDLIATCVIGDGEAETGLLATAWHSNQFLNPVGDGAVLPILHLNGWKIANPTVLARISHEELEELMKGYGYEFDTLFTTDKPVIFAFHGYALTIPTKEELVIARDTRELVAGRGVTVGDRDRGVRRRGIVRIKKTRQSREGKRRLCDWSRFVQLLASQAVMVFHGT